MYMNYIKLFAKNEKELETLIHAAKFVQSGQKDGIWFWKMCHASNEKRMRDAMGLPNQEKI